MKNSELVQLKTLLVRYKRKYEANTMAGKAIEGLVNTIAVRIKQQKGKEET